VRPEKSGLGARATSLHVNAGPWVRIRRAASARWANQSSMTVRIRWTSPRSGAISPPPADRASAELKAKSGREAPTIDEAGRGTRLKARRPVPEGRSGRGRLDLPENGASARTGDSELRRSLPRRVDSGIPAGGGGPSSRVRRRASSGGGRRDAERQPGASIELRSARRARSPRRLEGGGGGGWGRSDKGARAHP